MTRLTLVSRDGCHLCEVAEQTLDRIGASTSTPTRSCWPSTPTGCR
jgi:hypothetical protein